MWLFIKRNKPIPKDQRTGEQFILRLTIIKDSSDFDTVLANWEIYDRWNDVVTDTLINVWNWQAEAMLAARKKYPY